MKKADVKVGGLYTAKVSGKVVTVRVDAIREVASTRGGPRGGDRYDITNLATGRKTVFRSATRFRGPAVPPDNVSKKVKGFAPAGRKTVSVDYPPGSRTGTAVKNAGDPNPKVNAALARGDVAGAEAEMRSDDTGRLVGAALAGAEQRPDPTPASGTPPVSSPAGAGAATAAASRPESGPAAPASTTRNGSSGKAWTDDGYYHVPKSFHPPTCAGCTSDAAKHGKPVDPKRRRYTPGNGELMAARAELEALGGQYRSPPANDGGESPAPAVPVTGGLAALAAELAPKPEDRPPPHVIVKACAGTGKTTTLVQGVKGVLGQDPTQMVVTESGGAKRIVTITPSPQQRAVWDSLMLSAGRNETVGFVAFNKPIADHLRTVVPPGCDAMTMHSMGFRAVRRAFPRVRVNEYRTEDIVADLLGQDIRNLRRTIGPTITLAKRLAELCKMNLVRNDDVFAEHGWTGGIEAISKDQLDDLVSYYELDTEGARQEQAYELAVAVLLKSMNPDADGCVEFGDMIWLPVVLGLPVYRYGLLLVDEAQDLNRCQQELAVMAGRRLVLCGDPRQAIYGFAGADATSLPRMFDRLSADPRGCVELPLTVTRRCGKAIVDEARAIVPEFEAHESNPDGLVTRAAYPARKGRPELPWEKTYCALVKPGDMVVCRCNAPLVGQCFRFIKRGLKANIQGRDVGRGLVSTVTKMKADSVPDLVGRLDDWLHAETAKEQAKRNPSEGKLIMLQDRYDCIVAFCEGAAAVEEVVARIDKVFTDDRDAPGVRFSSIHKAKGLEADSVFLIEPEGATVPHPMAKSDWQRGQEINLRYVAITRAINTLTYVS